MRSFRLHVAGRSRDALDRQAEALVQSVIGRTHRKWAVDPFPAGRGPPLEIRVREKAVDRDRTEAFGGVKHEDRDVPREECGERRSHRLRRSARDRNENASYEL